LKDTSIDEKNLILEKQADDLDWTKFALDREKL
jgi:hypothetical protein